MKDLLTFIVKAIAQKQGDIAVSEEERDGIVNLTLSVAKEDMGRVIGKEGKIIRAIRTVLRVRAQKEGKRVNLTLSEQ